MRASIIGFIMFWLAVFSPALSAQDYDWEDISRGNYGAGAILVDPRDNMVIFAGVTGGVLKSDDGGGSWRRVLAVRGGSGKINALAPDYTDPDIIYAAADDGLYRSNDCGKRWKRIFRGKNDPENKCTSVLSNPQALFVGTSGGLFISRDRGRSWDKQRGEFYNDVIFNIDASSLQGGRVYLAAACGIFRFSGSGDHWQRVYVGHRHNSENGPIADAGETEEDGACEINYVLVDPGSAGRLYFSGSKGVYKSIDQGDTWSKLPEYGLFNRDVRKLCLSGASVFGLTHNGVFVYDNERWQEVSFGLSAGELTCLTLNNKGCIYVGAEKGIFKSRPQQARAFSGGGPAEEYLKGEPGIRDVQKAAIQYAEVSPEKISQWRSRAQRQALLPKFSIGLERDSTDLWHWETGSSAIGQSGDDLLRKGRDSLDWEVVFSWDLGELIWNQIHSIPIKNWLCNGCLWKRVESHFCMFFITIDYNLSDIASHYFFSLRRTTLL